MARVEVYGETELLERLVRAEAHTSALVSIGNPRYPLSRPRPGTFLPTAFRASFAHILRLSFFDADTMDQLVHMRPRRIASRKDVEKVVRFYENTLGRAECIEEMKAELDLSADEVLEEFEPLED